MVEKRLGVAIAGPDAGTILARIRKAESLGVSAAWLTTGGAGLDGLTILAVAAAQTESILLGTSIIPTYPRHPVAVAQQVQVIAQLAPGRFRLGVGPSHRPTIDGMFGLDFSSPLGNLREYLRVIKPLLQEGSVEFEGQQYRARAVLESPVDVPVMASALRSGSFELCGAEADGAISWVCPPQYLRDVALPAIAAGAKGAGREAPPLIAHVPVCVHEDPDEVREAVRAQAAIYPRLRLYQRMFAAAGYPEASDATWSDAMIKAVVASGDESSVEGMLRGLFEMGATEVLASLILAGPDQEASLDRALRLLGKISPGD
jgi:F420-dependent oxidoreductase-like protein